MKLEHLFENPYRDVMPDDDFIRENAKPYLNAVGGLKNALFDKALFRGIHGGRMSSMFIEAPRINRSPKDTLPILHNMAIESIRKAGGVANRDNSFFAVRSWEVANQYGDVYVMIPLGDYHTTYLEGVDDFTDDVYSMVADIWEEFKIDFDFYSLIHFMSTYDKMKNSSDVNSPKFKKMQKAYDNIQSKLYSEIKDRIEVDTLDGLGKEQEVMVRADYVVFIEYNLAKRIVKKMGSGS
jgi:hypothetical protein